MTLISMPPAPGAKTIKSRELNVVGVTESPFSDEQQVFAWDGQKWGIDVNLPIMSPAVWGPWAAAFSSLNGRLNTFLFPVSNILRPQGVATGAPTCSGSNPAGSTSLVTAGWAHGVAHILRAGDKIQVGSNATARLHRVLADVNSSGAGAATLTIWPALRASATGALVLITPMTQFRLDADPSISEDELGNVSCSFSASEAL